MVRFTKIARGAANIIDIGSPPPPGLEPIGNGWYRSPDVVDPRDCNNYPDSPWCGGNPIDPKLADLGVEIGIDECHVHASLTGTLGFIKMPPRTISYVRPECVDEYEKNRNPPPPPSTPKQPGTFTFEYPPGDLDEEAEVFCFCSDNNGFVETVINSPGCLKLGYPASIGCADSEYSQWGSIIACSEEEGPTALVSAGKSSDGTKFHNHGNLTCATAFGSSITTATDSPHSWNETGAVYTYGVGNTGIMRWWEYAGKRTIISEGFVAGEIKNYNPVQQATYYMMKGKWKLIKAFLARPPGRIPDDEYLNRKVDLIVRIDCKLAIDDKKPPPPPPPKKECCPMGQCCPQSPPVDNSLLRRIEATLARIEKNIGIFPVNATIFDASEDQQEAQTQTVSIGSISQGVSRTIERVEKVSKIIGIDALPLTVPETISEPVNQNILQTVWDWLTPDATRRINNLFELLVWQTEQYSATMGQWQQSIEIEDTDVLQEGNQKQKIALPDVATTLKEILSLQMQTYKTLGLVLDICLKDLTQDAATYKELIATQMNIKEMIDFLDYQTDEKYVDVPVQISVPGTDISQEEQNNLAKYLKPSTIKVRYQNWTGYKSLTDLLTHLATLMGRR